MQQSHMILRIIKTLDTKYKHISPDCLDMSTLRNMLQIYDYSSSFSDTETLELSEINLECEEIKQISSLTLKKQIINKLQTDEFLKKYDSFIKIIYMCLKLDISIFNTKSKNIVLIKTNKVLLESLSMHKRQVMKEHLSIIKEQYKFIDQEINDDYLTFVKICVSKMKAIDRLSIKIRRLIEEKYVKENDSVLNIVLPYFYNKIKYIEEYK